MSLDDSENPIRSIRKHQSSIVIGGFFNLFMIVFSDSKSTSGYWRTIEEIKFSTEIAIILYRS